MTSQATVELVRARLVAAVDAVERAVRYDDSPTAALEALTACHEARCGASFASWDGDEDLVRASTSLLSGGNQALARKVLQARHRFERTPGVTFREQLSRGPESIEGAVLAVCLAVARFLTDDYREAARLAMSARRLLPKENTRCAT